MLQTSQEMRQFFDNLSKEEKNENEDKMEKTTTESFLSMEKNCSKISQTLKEINCDLGEILENTNSVYSVSSMCQYHASCACVSLQSITETSTKPTFFSRLLKRCYGILLFISNVLFAAKN